MPTRDSIPVRGENGAPLPELVALLAEPMNIGVEFIQGAVRHGLGIDLPTDRPNSTEFVTGEFLIFFVQFGGRLLQLKFMPLPYFDEKCLPFVNGDPVALARSIRSSELRKTVKTHQGWIAVTLMNAAAIPPDEDSYLFVGKLMAALVIVAETEAIICPAENQIRRWDFDMLEALQGGNALTIFQ